MASLLWLDFLLLVCYNSHVFSKNHQYQLPGYKMFQKNGEDNVVREKNFSAQIAVTPLLKRVSNVANMLNSKSLRKLSRYFKLSHHNNFKAPFNIHSDLNCNNKVRYSRNCVEHVSLRKVSKDLKCDEYCQEMEILKKKLLESWRQHL